MPTASIARLTSSIGGRSRGEPAQQRAASSCHASGVPHANLSALASPSADGFAASAKLLDAPLADAARARGRPLCVWVVDDDASLRAAWELRVPCVITNLPTWAARRGRSMARCGNFTARMR